jgi:hypothetical protein
VKPLRHFAIKNTPVAIEGMFLWFDNREAIAAIFTNKKRPR